jgi:hypothetical protein
MVSPEHKKADENGEQGYFGIYCCIDCLTGSGTPRLPSIGIRRFPARGLASGLLKNSCRIAIPSGEVRNLITSFFPSGDESSFPRITPSKPRSHIVSVPSSKESLLPLKAYHSAECPANSKCRLYKPIDCRKRILPNRAGRKNPCRHLLNDGREPYIPKANPFIFGQP